MTLPNLVFFPQAFLPLHIFEPRYREMLRDVLASNRLFAVACLDSRPVGKFEPLHRVATIGMVRTCQKAENGTSNLLLQGLVRIECQSILDEQPYRRIRVRALSSHPAPDLAQAAKLRTGLAQLIAIKQRLGGEVSRELIQFLKTIDDPEAFLDLAAFNLCHDSQVKQSLLETLDVPTRFDLFSRQLRNDIAELKLRQKLQGKLSDGDIGVN
ncbi:MAG: LON peptidase substrate-binding domain-containing protein [Opitutaceae bacterium]